MQCYCYRASVRGVSSWDAQLYECLLTFSTVLTSVGSNVADHDPWVNWPANTLVNGVYERGKGARGGT